MKTRPLFRRASVDRLSSPDQIDRLLAVTQPLGWLALVACALLIAVAAGWGLLGTIPVTIPGEGILVRSGGIYEVMIGTSGRLVDLAVGVGEQVRQGQVVARIAQPELSDKMTQAQIIVRNRQTAHQQLIVENAKRLELQARSFDQQTRNVEQSLSAARENVEWFDDKIRTQRELVADGRLTKQALVNTLQQDENLKERIRRLTNELSDIRIKRQQSEAEHHRQLLESNATLVEAQTELKALESRVSTTSEVVSPHTGRIIELMAELGNVVAVGDPLFSLDLTGRTVAGLEAVIYVSSKEGKRLRPGMAVQIAPSVVRAEEFGHLLARVTYVSDFPTSSRGMLRVLKNQRLVEALSGDSPPHEVHASLAPALDTPSGYRWSSSKGPFVKIQSGTMCAAEITIDERRPIDLVVPFLRRASGL